MAGDIKRFVRMVLDRVSAKKTEQEMQQALGTAGQKAGANFLRELRAQFDKRMADLRVQLSKGLINPAEFRKQADLAAKQFNAGITKGMEEARRAGTLTEKEYLKLSRTLKRVGDEGGSTWDRIKRSITTAGAALAAYFGARQIGRFLSDSIRQATEAEAVWNRLAGALDTVGVAFSDVEHEVTRAATAMQRATVVGDEEFAEILTELVTTSGDYANSLQNVQLVADLAAAKQIDLRTAAQLVGKVMVGETGTLKRYGIVVAEGADALEVMRQKFAGMAENEARTFAGRTKQLANAWGDFKEALGNALIDASRGPSVLDRITRAVYHLTENIGELVALVGNLTRAILVAGAVSALVRLRGALVAANLAATGFLATLRGGLVLLGPKGWFVLGVAALTAAFQNAGRAAREAARDAADALEMFRRGLDSLPEAQLAAEALALETRRAELERRLAALKATPARIGAGRDRDFNAERRRVQELTRLEAERADVNARLSAILEERRTRALGAQPPDADPVGERDGAAARHAQELDRINRELAVQDIMREQQVTEERAKELQRREELMAGHVRRIVATVEEGWRRLDQLDLLRRAGLDQTPTPQVQQTTQREPPITGAITEAVEVSGEAAATFQGQWSGAMETLRDELEQTGGTLAHLSWAIAEGGFKGLMEFAKAKVKENLAAAIENAARALGFFGLGNPFAARFHLKAAAQHGAAAAAWKLLAGGGGSTAGRASASAASAASSPDNSLGTRTAEPKQDVTIVLSGPGWSALNPEVQRVVYGAEQLARERYGQHANVRIRRAP